MARGAVAKVNVANKIAEAFGKDFIGEFDKKIYVWATENGERVQIAISMTCPKTFIETDVSEDDGGDFDWSTETPDAPTPAPVEIPQEERDTVEEMMRKLGL